MSKVLLPEGRSVKILSLLKKHGPLSARALDALIDPSIKRKRMNEGLRYLLKHKLLIKRNEGLFGGSGVYYQIPQDEKSRTYAASLLECNPEDLKQLFFRARELRHSEECALWASKLQKMFPDAKVLREHEFDKYPLLQQIIISIQSKDDFKPDIVLMFGGPSLQSTITIAIEVERSLKSKKRIHYKLNKYANGSRFDGVLYVCESDQLSEAIQNNFTASVMHRLPRVKHYKDYFMLFANNNLKQITYNAYTAGKSPECVSIEKWIRFLRDTPDSERSSAYSVLSRSGPA